MLRNPLLLAQVRILLVLNEVLSLNAQESRHLSDRAQGWTILNEVLSLNAQEFRRVGRTVFLQISSMKS